MEKLSQPREVTVAAKGIKPSPSSSSFSSCSSSFSRSQHRLLTDVAFGAGSSQPSCRGKERCGEPCAPAGRLESITVCAQGRRPNPAAACCWQPLAFQGSTCGSPTSQHWNLAGEPTVPAAGAGKGSSPPTGAPDQPHAGERCFSPVPRFGLVSPKWGGAREAVPCQPNVLGHATGLHVPQGLSWLCHCIPRSSGTSLQPSP